MRNPFSKKTRELFFYKIECDWCHQNQWDALHHILGRKSSSPLNASPIHNMKCHIGNGMLENDESRSKLLQATYAYLMSENYRLTEEDKEFMEDHKYLYEL
jgi:hypothetical protein